MINLQEIQKEQWDLFFKPSSVEAIAQGASLEDFTALADKVTTMIQKTNPLSPDVKKVTWELNEISNVKKIIAEALKNKQKYYNETLIGKIKKFILIFFCVWEKGYTHSIKCAENFLFKWDFRFPVMPISEKLSTIYYFPHFLGSLPCNWVKEKQIDTSQLYNYDSPRKIEVFGVPYSKGNLPADFPPHYFVSDSNYKNH